MLFNNNINSLYYSFIYKKNYKYLENSISIILFKKNHTCNFCKIKRIRKTDIIPYLTSHGHTFVTIYKH